MHNRGCDVTQLTHPNCKPLLQPLTKDLSLLHQSWTDATNAYSHGPSSTLTTAGSSFLAKWLLL